MAPAHHLDLDKPDVREAFGIVAPCVPATLIERIAADLADYPARQLVWRAARVAEALLAHADTLPAADRTRAGGIAGAAVELALQRFNRKVRP